MTTQSQTPDKNADDTVVDQDLTAGQANPLELSDEDFLKAPIPSGQPAEKPAQTNEGGADGNDDDDDQDDKSGGDGKPAKTEGESGAADGAKPDARADEGKTPQTPKADEKIDGKGGEKTTEKVDDKDKKDGKEGKDEKSGTDQSAVLDVNGKAAAYDRLMAPFKANGREIAARSVEDAISLMQMGANYNKKMAGLKPVIRIAKLLENNGLLDEEKLSFLIDVSKKDPAAINKLVKDSGLNPMDLDPEKAGEYRSTKHTVDDREMALDEVLDDIKESPSYGQTLAIARGWDEPSKKVIGDYPAVLKVINDHIDRGLYPLITAEVERERTFGRLQGLSDIEAYRQVGDAIQARGGFNHLVKPDGAAQRKTDEAGKVVEPKPKKDEDEGRNDKRRALGTPRPAAPSGSNAQDYNPLALSDADFAKQATPKFR